MHMLALFWTDGRKRKINKTTDQLLIQNTHNANFTRKLAGEEKERKKEERIRFVPRCGK